MKGFVQSLFFFLWLAVGSRHHFAAGQFSCLIGAGKSIDVGWCAFNEDQCSQCGGTFGEGSCVIEDDGSDVSIEEGFCACNADHCEQLCQGVLGDATAANNPYSCPISPTAETCEDLSTGNKCADFTAGTCEVCQESEANCALCGGTFSNTPSGAAGTAWWLVGGTAAAMAMLGAVA